MKKKRHLHWICEQHFHISHCTLHSERHGEYLQAQVSSSVCGHSLSSMKRRGQREREGKGVRGKVGVQGSHYSSETPNFTITSGEQGRQPHIVRESRELVRLWSGGGGKWKLTARVEGRGRTGCGVRSMLNHTADIEWTGAARAHAHAHWQDSYDIRICLQYLKSE